MTISVEIRFWTKTDMRGQEECWLWKGAKYGNGYGMFWLNGRTRPAHRVAWELHHNKPFPEGKLGCHSCDNPICVNPHHIWPGTMSENILDARAKGRIKMPHETGVVPWNKRKTHCIRGHALSGENLLIKDGPKRNRACRVCTAASKQKWEKNNRVRKTKHGVKVGKWLEMRKQKIEKHGTRNE
ncbi:MAG TPA: HNH endonuclease [Rhabdochlamydiaceae bacterium]|nr:HNH endonuclease [Rhabdochlamydiaceae bacterium]